TMMAAMMTATTAPVGIANGQHDGFQLPMYGHVQHLGFDKPSEGLDGRKRGRKLTSCSCPSRWAGGSRPGSHSRTGTWNGTFRLGCG
ncbi:MAG: hypothetical protein AAF399_28635, partial [Bacteroidota bacterium]